MILASVGASLVRIRDHPFWSNQFRFAIVFPGRTNLDRPLLALTSIPAPAHFSDSPVGSEACCSGVRILYRTVALSGDEKVAVRRCGSGYFRTSAPPHSLLGPLFGHRVRAAV